MDNGGSVNLPCRIRKAKECNQLENMNKTPFQKALSVNVPSSNQRNKKPESNKPIKKLL